MLIVIIILVLAIGAGMVSAYQYWEGVKKDKENDTLNAEIKAVQFESLELSKKLLASQNETIIKAEELVKAQKGIIDLQNRLNLYTIGDGKIPLLTVTGKEFKTETTQDYKLSFKLHNTSDYPLRNISLKFLDDFSILNKIKREYGSNSPSFEAVLKIKDEIDVQKNFNSLPPKTSKDVYVGYIPADFVSKLGSINQHYIITLTWDNGWYELTFSLKMFDGILIMKDIEIWDSFKRENLNIKDLYNDIKYDNLSSDKSVYALSL